MGGACLAAPGRPARPSSASPLTHMWRFASLTVQRAGAPTSLACTVPAGLGAHPPPGVVGAGGPSPRSARSRKGVGE